MIKFILNILAPKKCLTCNKEGFFLCEDCYEKIKDFEKICYVCTWLSKNFSVCATCKNEVFYDKIMVLKHYRSENFSKIIKQGKFYGKKEIFLVLSQKLYELFLENEKIRKKDDFFLISVPSFWTRKFQRWYNSSQVLARYFSKVSGIEYKNILRKTRNTLQQSKLSRKERLTNLENSIKIIKRTNIAWKKIIVVDDVVSTGTTINEIAKILKQNWAKKVIWLCLASN